MAVHHLVGLGHRRIAHIDGGNQGGAPERRAGYRAAMIEHGLQPELRVVAGGIETADGYNATMRLFEQDPVPTAIVAFNDECAAGVLSAAAVLGIDVPGQLSVVGYDDSRRAQIARVPLTTFAQTYEDLATATIDKASQRLGPHDGFEEVVTEPQLVVRRSTGPVAA